jgi:rhamnogalacturonyl hydrolase YesR
MKNGIKAYNWTKNKLQAPEGVFWNNINLKGNIDRRLYPYNSGTMLHASVLLYKITKDERYLKEAKKIAKASFNIFTYISKNGERFFYKHPWFVTILFRGYLELYKIDNHPEYINTLIRNIDYAWENARDEYGLVYHDWSGEVNEKKSPKWLLHEACMVELYARVALLKLGLF